MQSRLLLAQFVLFGACAAGCGSTPPPPPASTSEIGLASPAPRDARGAHDRTEVDDAPPRDFSREAEGNAAAVPSEPCAEFQDARVVRIEPIEDSSERVVRITAVEGGTEDGVGYFHSSGRYMNGGAYVAITGVFFTEPVAEGPPPVDCMAPGICRRAFYLSCSDGNHAEVVEPGQYGSFSSEPRAGSTADGGWAPLRELRSSAEEQVEITWSWTGARYERSAEGVLTPPTPALVEGEGARGLPAVSGDGRRLALVHHGGTELEGLGANYEDLRVYRVRDGRLLRTIRVFSEDVYGESTLSPDELGRAYRLANALLSRGDFHPLTRMETLHRGENPILDASGAGVRLTHSDGTFHVTGDVQVEHTPTGPSASAYCCGMDSGFEDTGTDDAACELQPRIRMAWADGRARVVLVAHSAWSSTSGCEGEGGDGYWMHRGAGR